VYSFLHQVWADCPRWCPIHCSIFAEKKKGHSKKKQFSSIKNEKISDKIWVNKICRCYQEFKLHHNCFLFHSTSNNSKILNLESMGLYCCPDLATNPCNLFTLLLIFSTFPPLKTILITGLVFTETAHGTAAQKE